MNIDLLVAPYDTALRGWRMGTGPESLVAAGLIPRLEALGHAVTLSVMRRPPCALSRLFWRWPAVT